MFKETEQIALWNTQHARRGTKGPEGSFLRNTPNDTARLLNDLLRHESMILEVGSANGRDARFWASQGHHVIATDFSPVALSQLRELAQRQGLEKRITIIEWDINCGLLPPQADKIDAFYARSALHIEDEKMLDLALYLNRILIPESLIVIEGKSEKDKKIQRSIPVGGGLYIDLEENGHLRRAWTEEFARYMCRYFNWEILKLEQLHDQTQKANPEQLRLIAKKS